MSKLDLSAGNIQVSENIVFTSEESCLMAHLIAKRFAYDYALGAIKWRKLLLNSCDDSQFKMMAELGRIIGAKLGVST